MIHTVTVAPEDWQRDRSAIRRAARKAARAAGCKAYSIRAPDGTLLHVGTLPAVKLKPGQRPGPRITPEAVEAAYREHGARAPDVLMCSRQHVSATPELRAARDRAYAARGELVPRGTGRPPRAVAPAVLRLYLTPPEVVALEQRAHAAGRPVNAQVALDVEAWLAAPGKVQVTTGSATTYSVRVTPEVTRSVEAAVGTAHRTRAIEAAVRRGNAGNAGA